MRDVRHILLMMVMFVFVFHTMTNAAMAACNCADMPSDMATSAMPCHEMDQTDNAEEPSSEHMAHDCGHCSIPSPATLNLQHDITFSDLAAEIYIPYSGKLTSLMPSGIDNPPELIS